MQKPKIAIFHSFLNSSSVGGAERLIIELKEQLGCDFWVGGLDTKVWSAKNPQDPFASKLFNTQGRVYFLHKESSLPIWRVLKRLWNMKYNSKIQGLNNYDIVLFSMGHIFFVPQRLNSEVKKIAYINSPPRYATDQQAKMRTQMPRIFRPLFDRFSKWILNQWIHSLACIDKKIANSQNIQNRVFKYTAIKTDNIVFPPVNTKLFSYIETNDFYLSHARLEEIKRIPLILEAFKRMPEKKLIICSTGPLKNYVSNYIQKHQMTNVSFEGRVSNERLRELIGTCCAGIYIPENEDAGMTQLELMSAGKPVIGVREGGLIESVIDNETGILLPPFPKVDDLVAAVHFINTEKAKQMRAACEQQSKKYDTQIFFKQIEHIISLI